MLGILVMRETVTMIIIIIIIIIIIVIIITITIQTETLRVPPLPCLTELTTHGTKHATCPPA
jgi:hypothetical protein